MAHEHLERYVGEYVRVIDVGEEHLYSADPDNYDGNYNGRVGMLRHVNTDDGSGQPFMVDFAEGMTVYCRLISSTTPVPTFQNQEEAEAWLKQQS